MSFASSGLSLSLTTKLILGFLLITVPSVSIIGATSFYAFRELTIVNQQLQEISRSLEATRDLEAAVARTMLPPSEFLIHGTPGEDQRFETLMNEVEAQLQSCASAACHGAATQPKEMANALSPHVQRIKDVASAIFRLVEPQKQPEKFHLLHEINHQAEELNQHLERMSSALLLRADSHQSRLM
jgi:hypothetical protein